LFISEKAIRLFISESQSGS